MSVTMGTDIPGGVSEDFMAGVRWAQNQKMKLALLEARKPFDFPEVFKIPTTNDDDDDDDETTKSPILLDEIVHYALEAIKNNINKCDDGRYRVPPVAITSVARSGKTTLL